MSGDKAMKLATIADAHRGEIMRERRGDIARLVRRAGGISSGLISAIALITRNAAL